MEEEEQAPPQPHTWSQAFENVGLALIFAVCLLAIVIVCTWGGVQLHK